VVIALGLYLAGKYRGQSASGEVYRIGWETDPPFQQNGANGVPTGFAVELVREAARRRGIRLQWVYRPAPSENALRQELVDLWPLITILPERAKLIHISDPYIQHDHYLVVPAGSSFRQPQDLAAATVSLIDIPVAQRLARVILPAARFAPVRSVTEVIKNVCEGRTDAAFVEEFATMSSLLGGLNCSGQPLRVIWVPGLQTRLGIGATFRAAGVADAIRDEISAMGRDNSLPGMMSRWGYYSPRNVETMNALLNADRVQRRLLGTVVFFALLSLVALLGAGHIRRQGNRIKREVAERALAETAVREWESRFRHLLEFWAKASFSRIRSTRSNFTSGFARLFLLRERKRGEGEPAADLDSRPVGMTRLRNGVRFPYATTLFLM